MERAVDTSMTDPARIRAAINTIIDPCSRAAGAPAGLADMGLIRTLEVTASDTGLHVRAVIGVTEYGCLLGPAFAAGVTHVIQALPGISRVSVELDDAFDWVPEDMSPRYQDELARRREAGRKVFLPLIRADHGPHQSAIGSAPGRRIVSISCLDKNVEVLKSLSNLSTMARRPARSP
jgi:metal-sulfur cluster biosynthetic enzyme